MPGRKFQRNTRQREVILAELRKLTSHPTAADLYASVRRRLPRISLGTVYRNLELLAKMNVIQKLDLSGTAARFDANPAPHYHVRCVRCGRVGDVHEGPDDPLNGKITEVNGYEILGYRLEFFGLCPQCRKKPPPEDN